MFFKAFKLLAIFYVLFQTKTRVDAKDLTICSVVNPLNKLSVVVSSSVAVEV